MIHETKIPRGEESRYDAAVLVTAQGYATLCSVIQGGVLLRCSPGQPVSPSVTFSQFWSDPTNADKQAFTALQPAGRLSASQLLDISDASKRNHILLPRKVQSLSPEFESVIQTSGADIFFLWGHSIIKNIQLPAICYWREDRRKVFYCFIQNGDFSVLNSYLFQFFLADKCKNKKKE